MDRGVLANQPGEQELFEANAAQLSVSLNFPDN